MNTSTNQDTAVQGKKQRRRSPVVKLPKDVFKCCQFCDSPALDVIGDDVFCRMCGWNSMEGHIDAGGWDALLNSKEARRLMAQDARERKPKKKATKETTDGATFAPAGNL